MTTTSTQTALKIAGSFIQAIELLRNDYTKVATLSLLDAKAATCLLWHETRSDDLDKGLVLLKKSLMTFQHAGVVEALPILAESISWIGSHWIANEQIADLYGEIDLMTMCLRNSYSDSERFEMFEEFLQDIRQRFLHLSAAI